MAHKNYEDIGFAKIDCGRKMRNGYPEVIFGEGKKPAHAAAIFKSIAEHEGTAICTRASAEMANEVRDAVPEAKYHGDARLIIYTKTEREKVGCVVVATGGTADIPYAEEAALILETYGSRVIRLYDVGVAGLHRLLDNLETLRGANCVIAAAGMEGALPSVIGGLVSVPVIALPTPVGYGANLGGITALLAMLNSCAAGVSVVNVGNGFGAAYQADMINKLAVNGGTR